MQRAKSKLATPGPGSYRHTSYSVGVPFNRSPTTLPFSRPESLRRELEQALPDRPFTVRFWDGSEVSPTAPDGPVFTVRSPVAISHLLRAPGQLGLGRAYAAGELQADDLDRVIALLDR